MNIRTKTKRRVAILLAVALLIGVGTGAFVYVRVQQREAAAQRHREQGIAAAEKDRYKTALEHLSEYLRHNKDDVEALYHYGVARRNIEMPEGRHIAEAINILRRVVDLKPTYKDARSKLLELFTGAGYNNEAVELADEILQDHPKDVQALRAKATVLSRQREYEKALKAARKAVDLDPGHLRGHVLLMSIMRQLDRSPQQIVGYAQEAGGGELSKPAEQFLRGYAYVLSNDRDNASKWLKKATEGEPPNTRFVRMLVQQLRNVREYDAALTVLREHAGDAENDVLRRLLIRELWHRGEHQALLDRLSEVKPDGEDASSELLAFKALALAATGKREQVTPIIEQLKGRQGDNTATAWAPVLEKAVLGDVSPQQRVQICQTALTALPNSPYIRMFLGNAYASLGEMELAIQQWQRVAENAQSWAEPHVRVSRAMRRTSRPRRALQAAQRALRRAPENNAALVAMTRAWSAAVEAGVAPEGSADKLSQLLNRIQEVAPGEPRTFVSYLRALLRDGKREQAVTTIEKHLKDEEDPPSKRTLLQLAELSRTHQLGVAERCLELAESAYGVGPRVAYARAVYRAQTGQRQQAIKAMERRVEQHAGDDNTLDWKLAWARFLDRADADRAIEVWKELIEQNPDDIHVQRAAMGSPSVRENRSLMDRTIDRVKSLTGDGAVNWKLARARWLLAEEASQSDAAQAVVMLNKVVSASPRLLEARLLLAEAMRKVGNLSGAVSQLEQATNLRPRNMGIVLNLAQLRARQGNYQAAERQVDQVLSNENASRSERRQAAMVLAQAGKLQRATDVLEQLVSSEQGDSTQRFDVQARLLLAKLYERDNQLEKANQVYRELMNKAPRPDVIQRYADLLARVGRREEAKTVLSVLKRLDLQPGLAEMIRARWHSNHGKVERAAEHFRAAAEAAPDRAVPWRGLLALHLRNGNLEKVMKVNAEALEAIPGDQAFSMIDSHSELVRRTAQQSDLRPLVLSLVQNDQYRDVALQALRTIDQAREQGQQTSTMLREVGQLASQNNRFLPLQNVLVDLQMRAGRYDDAFNRASQAMRNFPNEAGPAKRAAQARAAQGQWEQALRLARQWRSRSQQRPLPADRMIARAQINLGNPQAAMSQLERYWSVAQENPGRLNRTVRLYTLALMHTGHPEKAATVLKPLLPAASGWRLHWLSLASDAMSDPQRAARWLERLEPTIPKDATGERLRLARTWYGLGRRHERQAMVERGLKMMRGLAESPDASAETIAAYAVSLYQHGDLDAAMTHYRRALEKDPNRPVALNNLAILIAQRGGNLDEALKLARRALESNPDVANFHDTLAFVLSKRGDHDKAVEHLQKAIELDPSNPEWRIHLATVHAEKGDEQASRRAYREARDLGVNPAQLSPEGRERWQRLQERFADRAAAAGA